MAFLLNTILVAMLVSLSGIPAIYEAMQNNGSDKPKFDTNEPERSFFITEIPIHKAFIGPSRDQVNISDNQDDNNLDDQVNDQVSDQVSDQVISIIEFCKTPKSKIEILDFIGLKNHSDNVKRHIQPLLENNFIDYTIKNNLTDRNQKYVQTKFGASVIKKYKATK